MKHLPAFKAAIFAAVGIFVGKEFQGFDLLFLSAGIGLLILLVGWFSLRRDRVATTAAIGIYAALSFAFAFYMSAGLSSLDSTDLLRYRGFAGTVEESPRDPTVSSIILNDCYGYDDGWWKIHGDVVLVPKFRAHLETGDRVVLAGKAGVVSDARNPGQFNARSYYALSGIVGRIYMQSERDLLHVYHDDGFDFQRNIIEPVRNFLRDRISTFMKGDEAGLARAMVIGERMGLGRDVNEQFISTGTVHILAVSGLHIGFFMAILMTIASILRIPRRLRFFVIAPILIFYAFIVGTTPSITRAVIMAVVVLFGLSLQRRIQILNSLGFAALVILTISPSQLFSPGFQLSFAAVLSIVFFHERILAMVRKSHPALQDRPILNSVVSLSVLTISATLGTIPLIVYYFNRISFVGVVANLFVVPLAGLFLSTTFTFLSLSVFSVPLASIYGAAAQLLGFLILRINSLLGSLSISSTTIADSGPTFALLYLAWLIAVASFGRDVFWKKLTLAALLGFNIVVYSSLLHGRPEAKLFVLDVGQGDAIYVELPNGRNMLVDAGIRFGSYDSGERVVVPFLERRGIKKLDYLVITHLHSDHIGGAVSVMRNLKVDNLVYPEQLSRSRIWMNTLSYARAQGVLSRHVHAGVILDSGSVCRVYVLHPNRKYVGEGGLAYRTRLNNGSVVLKVCIGKESALLAGDAEECVEHELVNAYGSFLASDIYKAGHHGSSTSSSSGFVRAIHPAYSLISVGARNSFGHPSAEVLNRMSSEGIRIWRTDLLGAAYFRINPETSWAVQWR